MPPAQRANLTVPPAGRRTRTVAALVSVVLLVVAGCSGDRDPRDSTGPTTTTQPRFGAGAGGGAPGPVRPDPELTLTTLSTRPEMVTGEEVLVEVEVPPGLDGRLRVTAGDADVSEAFASDGRTRRGLVAGLAPDATTTLTARIGDANATLDVTTHPTTGPVFSGTAAAALRLLHRGRGAGAPDRRPVQRTDEGRPPLHHHRRRPRRPARPGRPARRTWPPGWSTGERVPLIVRRERGVIDRGVYTFTVLDPTPGEPPPGAEAPGAAGDLDGLAWNDRLVWRFGGGCGTTYTQGVDLASAEDPALLARGYAVASSTAHHLPDPLQRRAGGRDGDDGQGAHHRGPGADRGDHRPGPLGRIDPAAPDRPGLPRPPRRGRGRAAVPRRHEHRPGRHRLRPAPAVLRHPGGLGPRPVPALDHRRPRHRPHLSGLGRLLRQRDRPLDGCPDVPEGLRYDADLRRQGIRCTLADVNVATLGVDPTSGFANRPLDNVGVQYGLNAFEAGRHHRRPVPGPQPGHRRLRRRRALHRRPLRGHAGGHRHRLRRRPHRRRRRRPAHHPADRRRPLQRRRRRHPRPLPGLLAARPPAPPQRRPRPQPRDLDPPARRPR